MKLRTREVQFKILDKNVTFFAPGMSKAVLWLKKNSLQNGQPCSCKKCYVKENTVWTFIWFMVSERPLRHECRREVTMLRYRENCRSATQVPRVPSNFSIASKTRRTHANPEPIVSYQCHCFIKFKFLQINPMKDYTSIYAIIPVGLPHKMCTLELNL